MLRHRTQKGDTIIEVLLAITVFSMVAIGSLTIMNQGATAAQRSLEITLVRQEIDAQAEALRMIYDEAKAGNTTMQTRWNTMLTWRKTNESQVTTLDGMVEGTGGGQRCIDPATITGRPFVVNTRAATLHERSPIWQAADLYSRVVYNTSSSALQSVQGIWVEAVGVPSTATTPRIPGHTDFHIRACWMSAGQSRPVTLGTVVRLYEP